MSDTSSVDRHVEAAERRWGEAAVSDLSDERVTKPGGVSVPPGVPKFGVCPSDGGELNGAIAAQTAKQILSDAGYEVFYRQRDVPAGGRDPERIVAIQTSASSPVAE